MKQVGVLSPRYSHDSGGRENKLVEGTAKVGDLVILFGDPTIITQVSRITEEGFIVTSHPLCRYESKNSYTQGWTYADNAIVVEMETLK